MAELEHVVKIFSLLEAAEKEQPFLTREQKQDLYRIAFHKESMEEVEKIILQLQAPHAGKKKSVFFIITLNRFLRFRKIFCRLRIIFFSFSI